MLLDNYTINLCDMRNSLITGLSGFPYAKRHWKQAGKIKSPVILYWHRSIAILEILPIIGSLLMIIEKIAFHIFYTYPHNPEKKVEKNSQSNFFNQSNENLNSPTSNKKNLEIEIQINNIKDHLSKKTVIVNEEQSTSTVSEEFSFD